MVPKLCTNTVAYKLCEFDQIYEKGKLSGQAFGKEVLSCRFYLF